MGELGIFKVAPGELGAFSTIGAALEAAEPGAEVQIHSGTYTEGLVLTKPVILTGVGTNVVVRARNASAILLEAEMASVSNLTLVGLSSAGEPRYCVDVPAGHLVLENCTIRSEALAGVAVRGRGASVDLRRCRIEDCRQGGLFFCSHSSGLVEDCEIVGSRFAGIEVRLWAKPQIQKCIIRNGKQDGVLVTEGGEGQFLDCIIEENGCSGLAIVKDGRPTLTRCTLTGNRQVGVLADASGRGLVNDCRILGNREGALYLHSGTAVEVVDTTTTWLGDVFDRVVSNDCSTRGAPRGLKAGREVFRDLVNSPAGP